MGVSGWMFPLVPAYPGCPRSKAVKRSLFVPKRSWLSINSVVLSVAVAVNTVPSVLWRCWLGGRKSIRPLKNSIGGVLALLSVWSKVQTWHGPADATATHCQIQIDFTFLVPAHPGSPGKRAVKRVRVCVCVCVWQSTHHPWLAMICDDRRKCRQFVTKGPSVSLRCRLWWRWNAGRLSQVLSILSYDIFFLSIALAKIKHQCSQEAALFHTLEVPMLNLMV